jgi:hypothetical protein
MIMAEACPVATRDITVNLQNRGKAIDKAHYGPMDPNQPNDRYWAEKARKWDVSPDEAKTQRCGTCAAFNQTSAMLKCIEEGIAGKGGSQKDAMDTIDAGDLGFCDFFDFKCAAARTCDAWVVGGPITDEDKGESEDETASSDKGEDMSEGESEYGSMAKGAGLLEGKLIG